MARKNKVPEFMQMAKELKKNASRYAASESVKFFKESFVKEGFTDSSFKAWQKTSNPLAGKRTLYKRGNLMRSIKKQSATMSKVVVIADSEYADIHNKGGFIVVTAQMKKFFWAKYYEFDKTGTKAEYCKAMALKPVGSKIKIPQHQFMGNSQTLMNNFDQWFGEVIKNQIEPHFNDSSVKIELRNV
ncbi:hypothetical protein [Carboxylicivirga linearis]|uniref:Phage protein n=1 Tax=Carboxylicivirga linearis TaxID=1628157 RepID=A0ABS5JWH9_9BACT|nr:hypothetical protein [Carboxylicivirga linearis]MBS2099178.1 hypothetical protein [Carboxylicivirga linearis]